MTIEIKRQFIDSGILLLEAIDGKSKTEEYLYDYLSDQLEEVITKFFEKVSMQPERLNEKTLATVMRQSELPDNANQHNRERMTRSGISPTSYYS